MRCVVMLSLALLPSCVDEGASAEQRYEMVKRDGTNEEICDAGKAVAAAYLEARDEQEYRRWRAISNGDCLTARLHGRDMTPGTLPIVEGIADDMEAAAVTDDAAPPPQSISDAHASVATAAHSCSGFYAYIPADRGGEVPFSVEVQKNAVEVLWMDYSPSVFSRKRLEADGSIVFHAENGGPSTLRCTSTGASIKFASDLETPRRSYALTRSQTDIWGIARKRGWQIDD